LIELLQFRTPNHWVRSIGSRWLPCVVIAGMSSGMSSGVALAQQVNIYFPQGIGGYDQQLGVTVQSRARPQYDPLGIQADGFLIHPTVSESVLYNSSLNGIPGSGTWGSQTSASVSASSLWARNSLNAVVGIDRLQFFQLPSESYTNWNVGLSGGYTIADSQLIVAYSHQSYNQLGTTIGAISSVVPVLDQTDSARIEYTFNFGSFSMTPDFSASAYRFGSATESGVTFNQNYLNYNALAAGVTTRYNMSDVGGLLLVARGVTANYISPQAGQPSNNSNSLQLLGGLDYQSKGPWRYQLLGGVEVREFAAAQYGTQVGPDVEGNVIWSPTSLTTLTGTVASAIEAPQIAGTSGYILSQAHLSVDHEFMRNIILQGRAGLQYAEFLQGGSTQTNFTTGAGVTWLFNRDLRLSLDYDFTQQTGAANAVTLVNRETVSTGQFTQNLIALRLRLGL
jgi:hypothetical protein